MRFLTRSFLKKFSIVYILCFTFSIGKSQDNFNKVRPEKRFGHYTEIGALATTQTTPDNVTTAAFSFQMVNGYRFNRWVFTGIGVGADLFATETIVPVFASVRGDVIKNKDFVPFYFVDLGYGINLTTNDDISYKGGLAMAAGMGFKINLINDKGFLVSFGYRFQEASRIQNNISVKRDYNRLALRAGFYL